MSAPGTTTMTVICAASAPRPPHHASRPPGSIHLLRGPLPNRPSTRRSVQSLANVPGLNFENFENDGVTTLFKVFKVSSLGQLAGTGRRNFENSENGGATTIFKVFRGVAGPRPAPVTTKNGERPVLILRVKVNHAVGGGPKRGQNKIWRASCAHFSEVKVSHAVGGGPKKSHG